MLLQNCLLSSAFVFWLLTFLIPFMVEKHLSDFRKYSVDLILVHFNSLSPYISSALLFLYRVPVSTYLSLILTFFSYAILPFKFLVFLFPPISPLWWDSKIFMCFLTSFIIFSKLLCQQGSSPYFFTPTSLKVNLFSYIDYNCFYQDICICNF